MSDHATIKHRIAGAAERIEAGFQRRFALARGYVADPWIQIGVALAVGYLLGTRARNDPDRPRPAVESVTHALVRNALTTLVSATIRQVIHAGSSESRSGSN